MPRRRDVLAPAPRRPHDYPGNKRPSFFLLFRLLVFLLHGILNIDCKKIISSESFLIYIILFTCIKLRVDVSGGGKSGDGAGCWRGGRGVRDVIPR